MADSPFTTRQYPSDKFVESCGAILFDLSSPGKDVCLVRHVRNGEWYLAKGRRNQGECRHDAALREVMEETGYRCHLHRIPMATRAPFKHEPADAPDRNRITSSSIEPFMFTMRQLDGSNCKIIWWFVAALEEGARANPEPGESQFKAEFFPYEQAMQKLTFRTDREVLENAWRLVSVGEVAY